MPITTSAADQSLLARRDSGSGRPLWDHLGLGGWRKANGALPDGGLHAPRRGVCGGDRKRRHRVKTRIVMGLRLVLIAISASLVIFFSSASVAAKPIKTTADTLLRRSPGTGGDVLRLLPKGTMVEIGACGDGWCRISFKGQDGFAMAVNFETARAPNPARGPVAARPGAVSTRPPLPRPRPAGTGGPAADEGSGFGHGFFAGWRSWLVCGQR